MPLLRHGMAADLRKQYQGASEIIVQVAHLFMKPLM
jgi:hypothetical protein